MENFYSEMEIIKEELVTLRLKGKLRILQESRRIIDELYWRNVKKEYEILREEKNFEMSEQLNELVKERRKLIQEIRKIDEQLG